jgi:hypothetical protein
LAKGKCKEKLSLSRLSKEIKKFFMGQEQSKPGLDALLSLNWNIGSALADAATKSMDIPAIIKKTITLIVP